MYSIIVNINDTIWYPRSYQGTGYVRRGCRTYIIDDEEKLSETDQNEFE